VSYAPFIFPDPKTPLHIFSAVCYSPFIQCNFSIFVSELAAELFSEVKSRHSLERLDLEEAAAMSRNACVSPCSLVLALLYLERLKTCNSDYLQRVAPSELFLVSMVKFFSLSLLSF
jgi:hypothetical protein